MQVPNSQGYCLVSQQIRDKIVNKEIIPKTINFTRHALNKETKAWFINEDLEKRVQPSSYEPTIDNHLFILDSDLSGVLRPNVNETIRKALLQLPMRQRQRMSIKEGFELKRGFSYLIPLEDKIKLKQGEYIISSPKSSRGRLFLNTRLLADFNPCFNEVGSVYNSEDYLELWLLVQPTKFNVIVHPGIPLTQLRFFTGGKDPKLSDEEVAKIIESNPLFYDKNKAGELMPSNHRVRDGLQIHLDLMGERTEKIVGLKARNNPNALDLTKKSSYEAEDYFEPITIEKNRITIERGDCCLFASQEIIWMPQDLSAELEKYSHIGISGSIHDAGFVDNGFKGNIVFEVRSEELTKIELQHAMPMSKLKIFRTLEIPDKIYGKEMGSSYQEQFGPRTSNNFKQFDYNYAKRNYKKLDRLVLTQDAKVLLQHRRTKEGFEFVQDGEEALIIRDIESGFFHSRYDCETDESVLQPIPYTIIFGPNETVFSYVRAEEIRDYGDERLFGKHSIGVGGHIVKADGPNYLEGCLEREVLQEEAKLEKEYSKPKLIGTLMAYE